MQRNIRSRTVAAWLDLGLDQNVDKQHFRFLLGPFFSTKSSAGPGFFLHRVPLGKAFLLKHIAGSAAAWGGNCALGGFVCGCVGLLRGIRDYIGMRLRSRSDWIVIELEIGFG